MDCAITPTEAPFEVSPSLSYEVSLLSSLLVLNSKPNLPSQVRTVHAGPPLARKLLHLALCHYDLASTTVTGIPMKEEQNAASSANYDVELFHRKSAHSR